MSDANVAPPLATNVMLSEWDTFCALSVEMEPLRSANDVGVLLQAMRQYPAGLPDRVILIAAELPAYSTQQIALLLARLDTVGIGLVQTSSRLADTGPQVHLLPPPTTCVVCGEPGLMVDRKPSSPTVVSERGILQGILHSKTCGKCGALHGMSYADGGSGLPSGKQMPYEGATARGSRWCQMSSKVVWENSLLYAFESQAVFSHTGYETFASEVERPGTPARALLAREVTVGLGGEDGPRRRPRATQRRRPNVELPHSPSTSKLRSKFGAKMRVAGVARAGWG